MPNPLYARLQTTADRLIKKFGQQGTVTRVVQSGPAYDPVLTPTDYPCMLAVMNIDLSKVDGTLIQADDKMAYISVAGLPENLTTADELTIAGQKHAMKIVRPLSPAGLTVFYEVIIAA